MNDGDRMVDDGIGGEVADVFHLYWDEYVKSNGASIQQYSAVDAIMRCRTRVMGGHTNECDQCGHTEIAYNSCRNRHCPKCQSISKLRWVEARKADLLPVPYFHVIFTVSHKLYRLLIYNERLCYDLLFRSVSKTLLQFADRELDGVPGITAVLHTWGQDMGRHVHLHCIVTGGALSHDHSKWNASYEGFLFDVTKMSEEFRKLYISGLRRAYKNNELCFVKKAKGLAAMEEFDAFLEESKQDDWVVFCQKPFGKPKIVLEYISRYSHRIAISNSRIVSIANGRVWFKYKDYREEDAEKQKKTMSLAGCQFIKRYLQHVLPQGFTKIRHYGIYSGSNRTAKMERCRELLSAPEIEQITTRDLVKFLLETIELDIEACPVCGLGRMVKKDRVFAEPIRCRGSTAA